MVDKYKVAVMLMVHHAGIEGWYNNWGQSRICRDLDLADASCSDDDIATRRSLIYVNLIEIILLNVNKYSSHVYILNN